MKKEDIEHLAKLSRIALTEEEKESLTRDITSILGYVGEIQSITGNAEIEKVVGVPYNVMRDDVPTNTPGEYTEDLLNAAPVRDRQYIKVKKILGEKGS